MMVEVESSSTVTVEEFFDALPEPPGAEVDEAPRWKGKGRTVATAGDVSYNPFAETLQYPRPKWKGKGKAVAPAMDVASIPIVSVTSADDIEVDWTKYEPPQGLNNVPNITSDIITRVMQQSIENIKARIAEEEQQRSAAVAAAAERLRREREAEAERAKNKSPEGLEVVEESESLSAVNGGSSNQGQSQIAGNPHTATFAGVRLTVDHHGMLRPVPPARSKRRSFMGLLRRLNITEKAESSAMGAARHIARKHNSVEITSRITTSDSGSPTASSSEKIIECVSCLDDFDRKDMVVAPCHSYCRDCFTRLITAACENEQQWPPKCCLNKIPQETVISNIDSPLQQRYRARAEEWNLPVSDRLYCSQPDCSLWVKPNQVNAAMRTARCTNGHRMCLMCRGVEHGNLDCPQDRDLMRTEELAEEEGWKRCYGCQAYVEHREACQHMTCRCGAEFCYVCGARWRTCTCTMDQLAAIKNGVTIRRQRREARQAEEEAEIAEALRLVEEFEREEALKAELLRQEQERLAEERRQRLLEERIRREGDRRRTVEAKFEELRETVRSLHELQRITVVCDQGNEEKEVRTAAEQLMEKHKETTRTTRKELLLETKAKLEERERDLKIELVARLEVERRTEEEYHQQLRTYWAGRRGGEEEAETSLRKFKRKMDQGFQIWEKWSQKELEMHHYHVKEEETIQLELMEEAERRQAADAAQQVGELLKKKTAEQRWVDVVIEERDRMLNEMEVDEIENGEDIDAWFAEDGLDDIAIDGSQSSPS